MPRRLPVAAVTLTVLLTAVPAARADWAWPVRGELITPYRNVADPYAAGQHRGIDIAAAVGAPVRAATGGEVRFAGTAGSSGLTVSIRTTDGRLDTSYLHLSSTTVIPGEHVSTGDRIGTVGTSGTRSTAAPHLHFGVRRAGTRHAYRNPLDLLPPTPTAPERRRPAPTPTPAPLPWPAKRAPVPREAPVPRGAPAPVPRGAPAPRPAPVTRPAPPGRVPKTARPAPIAGLDLGYALAIGGLLLAAGLLGLSEDGRRATRRAGRRGRAASRAYLRPFPARRP